MSVPAIYFVIVLMLFGAGVYSSYKKRGQIFCWFEGEDGTNEHKWVKHTDGWVIFRGYKYKIMTERMGNVWIRSGIHFFFPTRSPSLSFVWYSAWPRDPKNFSRTVISPQVRKVINLSEMVMSYFKTSTPTSTGKKQGILEKYGVIIAIVLVVIVAVYLYTNMQGLAEGMNALQNQINTLAR